MDIALLKNSQKNKKNKVVISILINIKKDATPYFGYGTYKIIAYL